MAQVGGGCHRLCDRDGWVVVSKHLLAPLNPFPMILGLVSVHASALGEQEVGTFAQGVSRLLPTTRDGVCACFGIRARAPSFQLIWLECC